MSSKKVQNNINIFRTWVIDPNHNELTNIYSLIDSLLLNAPTVFKLIQTTPLPNGLKAFKYLITKPNDPAYYALVQILSDISYDALIISLSLDDIDQHNNNLDLTGIDKCIKDIIKSVLNMEVSFNHIVHYDTYIQFLPHDSDGNRIYTDYYKVGEILDRCMLSSEKNRKYRYTKSEPYLQYLIDSDSISMHGVEERSDDDPSNTEYDKFRVIQQNFNNNDNFILKSECLNNAPELTISLYTEICQLWGFNIVNRLENELVINRSENNPIGSDWSLQEWFKVAKRSISLGKLISVTIEGFWQLWDTYKRPLISYAAHRAYIEDNYSYLSSLRVNSDYSITADFDSLQTYLKYKSKFIEYLNRSDDWTIINTNNFVDAIVKRYELGTSSEKYRNNNTLIISTGDSKQRVDLVTDLKLTNYGFIGKRQEFTTILRHFMSRCSKIFISPSETADLNSLSLEDMLQIIYSDDIDSNIHSSCFSKEVIETVKDMNLPLEPILSTDENISRYENLNYALSGYFDFGPLRGIYSKPPAREIKIPMGRVEATILYGSEDTFSATPIVSADFISPKGRRNLFKIATIEVFQVQDLIEVLWKDGWFLSDWGIAYYEKTGELSLSLIRDIPFLRMAADTPERGSAAIDLMKRVIDININTPSLEY